MPRVLTVVLWLLWSGGALAAGTVTADRWETYTNTRYGVLIDYPADLFAIQPPPPDNAGRNFEAQSVQARFSVYTHANALDQSRDELQAEDAAELNDKAAKIQSGEDWYQIVSAKAGETILRRVVLSEGGTMVHRLEIAFPAATASAFAPIVERMTRSFRVDPGIPEKAAENATDSPAKSAEGQKMETSGAWYIQLPSTDFKSLPNLTAESEFVGSNNLGRISFVCDGATYYLLLISPSFERKPSEQGSVVLGGEDNKFAATFRDLHGTRNPLGPKLDWDADILFAEIPVALLSQLADGGTMRVDLRGWSWLLAFKTIAPQVRSFTAFCETGRQIDRSHFVN